jgi:hypothetical protein
VKAREANLGSVEAKNVCYGKKIDAKNKVMKRLKPVKKLKQHSV